ncbi:hypothetical protein [Streptosporangium longisporum]|uniref:ACT domain-containing protein n=1 Tax=Streptosporangium longisporum TaxID=46187 RepID=A0ABP6KZ95_9ACTN
MTTRGRYSHRQDVQIRVVGTPGQVARKVTQLAQVLTITHQSRQVPRSDESGLVTVYLDVRDD